jgi:acyl-CoA reductase-like NAD-dependent aldehyde dehydrogenase
MNAYMIWKPYDPNTNIGPVMNEALAICIETWVDEAMTAGATIVGGTRETIPSQFIAENTPYHC